MRSRHAFDTVLKKGVGCVTHVIYMCEKAVAFSFKSHHPSHVLRLGQPTFFSFFSNDLL